MKVLISGVTGQDGSYLAEHCLKEGHTVIGLKRRTATPNLQNLETCLSHPNFILEEADITDYVCISSLLNKHRPEQIYNLAAQSHVATSFRQPFYTIQSNLLGPLNFLEVIRELKSENYNPHFYQASTSEMWGSNYNEKHEFDPHGFFKTKRASKKYQGKDTPFAPNSPYGVGKLGAHNLVRIYREGYDLFACCGILHNHESPRRGEHFLTRKVTKYIGWLVKHCVEFRGGAECMKEEQKLHLGNLDSYRDWSHAKDMVRAMYLMLSADNPRDYVVSSDEAHSVRDFVQAAFNVIGEKYQDFIVIDPELYRPVEVDYLCGNSREIREELGWFPKYSFTDLVKEMVEYDIKNY